MYLLTCWPWSWWHLQLSPKPCPQFLFFPWVHCTVKSASGWKDTIYLNHTTFRKAYYTSSDTVLHSHLVNSPGRPPHQTLPREGEGSGRRPMRTETRQPQMVRKGHMWGWSGASAFQYMSDVAQVAGYNIKCKHYMNSKSPCCKWEFSQIRGRGASSLTTRVICPQSSPRQRGVELDYKVIFPGLSQVRYITSHYPTHQK